MGSSSAVGSVGGESKTGSEGWESSRALLGGGCQFHKSARASGGGGEWIEARHSLEGGAPSVTSTMVGRESRRRVAVSESVTSVASTAPSPSSSSACVGAAPKTWPPIARKRERIARGNASSHVCRCAGVSVSPGLSSGQASRRIWGCSSQSLYSPRSSTASNSCCACQRASSHACAAERHRALKKESIPVPSARAHVPSSDSRGSTSSGCRHRQMSSVAGSSEDMRAPLEDGGRCERRCTMVRIPRARAPMEWDGSAMAQPAVESSALAPTPRRSR